MSSRWTIARNLLQALVAEAVKNPVTSLTDSENVKRITIDSPLSGFTFEARTSSLLNDTVMIEFEAERSYLFGLFYRSIYTILETSRDGTTEKNPIYSRFESSAARRRRRAWLQDDT